MNTCFVSERIIKGRIFKLSEIIKGPAGEFEENNLFIYYLLIFIQNLNVCQKIK